YVCWRGSQLSSSALFARPVSCSSSRRRPPTCTLFPYTTLFRSCTAAISGGLTGRIVAWLGERRTLYIGQFFGALGMVIAGEKLADRKSTRLNSSHRTISYAVSCLQKKTPPVPSADTQSRPLPPS